jgi:TRAP transporter TAXI family solute receptor
MEKSKMHKDSNEYSIRMRSEPVPWFGLFFSWITMMLGVEDSRFSKVNIELIPGDLPSVSAISKGEAEIGMTTPPACATMAYRGVGPFDEKMENLRAIMSFPHDDRLVWAIPEEFGITSIEELKDKELTFAVAGDDSPVGFAVDKILQAYGISLDEQIASGKWKVIKEDYLFKVVSLGMQGKADMVVHEGRKTPPWIKFAQSKKLSFLPIRDDILTMMEKDYGFRRAVLSKGMLEGAIQQDTPTLDWSEWLLFTRDDVSDELIYLITKIVVEYKHLFELGFKGQPVEQSDLVYPMDPKEIWKNVGVPLHPAAERYFKEHGHMAS